MTLLGLLVALFVCCVVIWAARALMSAFSIGEPIATSIYVILVLIMLVWLLSFVGMAPALRLG